MEKAAVMWYDGKKRSARNEDFFMKESIVRLRALEKQRFAYRYALNVVDFDAETVAPEGSADGRA